MTNGTDFCDYAPPPQGVMTPPTTLQGVMTDPDYKINKDFFFLIRRSVLKQSLLPRWTKHFFVGHILPEDYDVWCRNNSFASVLLFMAFI